MSVKHICGLAVLLLLSTGAHAGQPSAAKKRVLFFGVAGDTFSATGKWASTSTLPKDQITIPQEVQIDCFRGNTCIEATAEYYMGHPHISVRYPTIVRWNKDGIVAEDSTGACMSDTVLINFADQTVTATNSPKAVAKEVKDACSNLFGEQKSSTYIFVLRGSERWEKEHWGAVPERPKK